MKYYIRDWLLVLFIVIFSPFVLFILYLVFASSVIGIDSGMPYLYFSILVSLWVLINASTGYIVDSGKRTISYPTFFILLRRKVNLESLSCYEIIGFDEYGVSNRGMGFRKFKIILKGSFGFVSLVFNREEVARYVYARLKESVPSFGVREGQCLIK